VLVDGEFACPSCSTGSALQRADDQWALFIRARAVHQDAPDGYLYFYYYRDEAVAHIRGSGARAASSGVERRLVARAPRADAGIGVERAMGRTRCDALRAQAQVVEEETELDDVFEGGLRGWPPR
jgi:hypothetical protein